MSTYLQVPAHILMVSSVSILIAQAGACEQMITTPEKCGKCLSVTPELVAMAGGLLANFADTDTDGDGQLSLAEAQTTMGDLTEEQFAIIDVNGDGFLSNAEIEDIASIVIGGDGGGGGGCFLAKSVNVARKYLGDLFLLGIALLSLLSWRGLSDQH